MDERVEVGAIGEEVAVRHVKGLGWSVVARNARYRSGELDIVASDGRQLVFVEVRSRRGGSGPRAEDTVTLPKQRRLTRAAMLFLAGWRGTEKSARFDVIAVDAMRRRVISHYRGAFDAAEW